MAIGLQLIQLEPYGIFMNIHIVLNLLRTLMIYVRSRLYRGRLRGGRAPAADLGNIIGPVIGVLSNHVKGSRIVIGVVVAIIVRG